MSEHRPAVTPIPTGQGTIRTSYGQGQKQAQWDMLTLGFRAQTHGGRKSAQTLKGNHSVQKKKSENDCFPQGKCTQELEEAHCEGSWTAAQKTSHQHKCPPRRPTPPTPVRPQGI